MEQQIVDMTEINRQIDALERLWFEASNAANAARAQLARDTRGELRAIAMMKLAHAEQQKCAIMRQIEAIEDSLVA